jgi:hypothetical protein
VDYRVIHSTFDNKSINKVLLGFKEFEFSPPCSQTFPIELAFEPTEQTVVDVEYYIVSRIAGYHDDHCSQFSSVTAVKAMLVS